MSWVYADMVADLFHFGHSRFLRSAKKLAEQNGLRLHVGVHSDEDVMTYKRKPIMAMEERAEVLMACRWVDKVTTHAPLRVTETYLRDNDIAMVVHGQEADSPAYDCMYSDPIRLGIFVPVPRTPTIATTDILARMSARLSSAEPDTVHHAARHLADVPENPTENAPR